MRPLLLLALLAVCAGAPARAQPLDAQARCREAAPYRTLADTALAEGRLEDAMRELAEVAVRCPEDTVNRRRLRTVRDQVLARAESERMQAEAARRAAAASLTPEALFDSARTELQVFQTAHGALLGAAAGLTLSGGMRALASQRTPEVPALGATLVGALLGSSGAYLLASGFDPQGLTTGQAMAIDSGTFWGLWTGLPLLTEDVPGGPFLLPLGSVAGTVGGGLLGTAFRPRPGHVALTNSAGLWSAVLSALGAEALRPGLDLRRQVRVAVLASAAGLVAGALLGPRVPQLEVSRQRVALIDLGGLGGLLLSSAGMVAAGPALRDGPVRPLLLGSGLLLGLATATWLSAGGPSGSGEERRAPAVTLAPALLDRGAVGLTLGGVM